MTYQTYSMTESMDATDYAFYLAYGMTQEDEEIDSLINVEMYNTIDSFDTGELEASHRDVFATDA